MACTVSRPGWMAFFVIVLACGSTFAGELFRPVPPDAQVTRFTRFNIRYTLRDVIADGVERVEFYITDDMGKTWRLYGEDPDRVSPMTIQVPGEGVYGFVCVATDRFGNREREPGPRTRPESVIVVDRTPPQAKWLGPLQDILTKSSPVEFSWETSDPYFSSTPVRLQYAHNSASIDRNADWQDLQENLSAKGTFTWTPPADAMGKFNFRLVAEDRAGNITVAYNPSTVIIDGEPPRITSVSPLKSNKLDVDLYVEADDGPGGSGVKTVSMYTSANAGILWDLLKEPNEAGESVPLMRAPGSSLPFTAPSPGQYAIWPIAFDMAENASPMPVQGATGPFVLVIDNEPPSVTVSNSFLQGRGAVLSNETRVIEWTSYDPHPANGTGVLSLSLDNGNSWQEIASGLSSSGSTVVNFPFGATSEEAILKVGITDDFGNTGEGTSQTFNLTAADTTITAVTPVGSQPSYYPSAPSTSSSTSFGFPQDDMSSQPPMIPPPPQTSFPASPTTTAPITTAPFVGSATTYPTQPSFDPYTTSDPFSDPYASTSPAYTPPGASDPYQSYTSSDPYATPYATPTASDPYASLATTSPYGSATSPSPTYTPSITTDPYGGSSASFNPNESTAGTFPSAMLSGAQQPSTTATSSPQSTYIPAPTTTQSSTGIGEWNPTPAGSVAQQGTTTSPFDIPSSPATSQEPTYTYTPSLPTDTTSAPIDASSPWSLPTDTVATPAPSAPLTPPATTTDPFSSFGSDSQGFAPPPLMSDSGTATTTMPSLSFDSFGSGSLAPPPLPSDSGTTTATAPSAPVSTPPATPAFDMPTQSPPALPPVTQPGMTTGPDLAAAPTYTPPAFEAPQPAIEPTTSLSGDLPESVAPIAGFDSTPFDDTLRPPPMSAPSGLPSDPRQLSNHYAGEAKDYLDEGRVDLALDSATKSLNADNTNSLAYSRLAQAYVQQEPPNFARAATLAREATNIGRDWYSWWTSSDVFYRWAHARNRMVQSQIRSAQRPAPDLLDERNQALNNAQIAIGNASRLVQSGSEADREQVAMTQGEITYLRALSIPEPIRPAPGSPATAQDEYMRALTAYKGSITPILQEALPYFQAAMQLGGSPSYRETFHMGIINFRLGGLEKDTGNAQQAARYYQQAAQYLEEATIATQVPAEGPREAYYMLAYCHDQLAEQPGADRTRQKEMALRYWQRTADFYAPGSAYRDYSEQRMIALQHELGL